MAFGTQDETDEVMNEINMTPFVDVMLVLLIIFIITVPVMQHAVNIDLPRVSNQPENVKPETIRLSVDAAGTYYWNDAAVIDAAWRCSCRPRQPESPNPSCISVAIRQCATNAWLWLWWERKRPVCARSALLRIPIGKKKPYPDSRLNWSGNQNIPLDAKLNPSPI